MRFHTQLGSFASIAATIGLLAGCSGGSSQLPATPGSGVQSNVRAASHQAGISPAVRGGIIDLSRPSLPTWFSANSKLTKDIFVADYLNGVIEIFDHKTGTQTGQIGGLSAPEGLATDTAGNLYEANTGTQTIQIYAPPYSGSPKVLHDNGQYPVGLHVDASGNLWVANICSGSGGSCFGAGGVVEYKAGQTKPTKLSGAPGRSYFVTTNAAGDVWVDGQDQSGATPMIGYFKGGAGAFKTVHIALAFPGSVQFDKSGNLLLDDQSGSPSGGSQINIYPPGHTTPSGSITVQTTGDDVVAATLGSVDREIFAPLYLAGTTNVITYPAGTMFASYTPTTIGNPDAVAVVPAPLP